MKKIVALFVAAAAISTPIYAKDWEVVQKDKTFHPNHLKVKVGDRIIFKNDDGFAHNAFSDSEAGEFDIGMQKPGQDVVVTMKKPGKVEVECAIHPNMHLTIEVEK